MPAPPLVSDLHARPLSSLRLSVTDRCNLRCEYCMPDEEYAWLPRADILSFEEIARLVDVFLSLGVTRARLTGGEPLMRRGLPTLVGMLADKPGLEDLALTTNGVLLAAQGPALRAAGLRRVTVSLDTLRPDRFRAIARRDDHARVLEGIASVSGWPGLKLDAVIMKGVNDDEMAPLVEYAKSVAAEIRFIEYMDVGGALRWSHGQVVSKAEMLRALAADYGPIEPLGPQGSAPAERFRLGDGTVIGIISSTTAPFCGACDRSRLTADGIWYLCLYARAGTDLRALLRSGSSDEAIAHAITSTWRGRSDRGAEERLALAARAPLPAARAGDPHLEMHKRGG